jgi:hypothetical protein
MSWLRERVLGDPRAVAEYRRARQALQAHAPGVGTVDETLWRLDMRVLELSKTVPALRR